MLEYKMFSIGSNDTLKDWFMLMVRFVKLKNDKIRSFI